MKAQINNNYRNQYQSYDPELKRIVAQTGNLQLALRQGVPRTTANYWITNAKSIPKQISCPEVLLEKEIKSLKKQLEVERAKIMFVSSLAKYLFLIKEGKKKISKSIKQLFVKKIDCYKKYCSITELLSLIGLSSSRYFKWKSETQKCENTKKFECGVKRLNQLTGAEVSQIFKLVSSKKYFHFSLTSLWKFALRNGIVICSKDTWYKYSNMFSIRRNRNKKEKKKYENGVRAIYASVANMPGAVAKTSTFALTNATLPYALEIANNGLAGSIQENPEISSGVNIMNGKITCKGVAKAFGLKFAEVDKLLSTVEI